MASFDKTLFFQFGLFLIAYLAMTTLIFKPYLKAYTERKKSTVGNAEYAERILEEAHELTKQYESKAKTINQEFKKIYDSTRTEALRERDRIVADAKEKADAILGDARKKIQAESDGAQRNLASEVTSVSSSIASKLIGKDLSL